MSTLRTNTITNVAGTGSPEIPNGLAVTGALSATGASTAQVVAEKQRLRDITKAADTATTLDQLKSLSAEGAI